MAGNEQEQVVTERHPGSEVVHGFDSHAVSRVKSQVARVVDLDNHREVNKAALDNLSDIEEHLFDFRRRIEQGDIAEGDAEAVVTRLAKLKIVDEVLGDWESLGRDTLPPPAGSPSGRTEVGYGYGAQRPIHPITSSVSKEGYHVITKKEDNEAIDPAMQVDPEAELINQAYYEMVNSLNERVVGTYESERKLDVQTSKNTRPISLLVLGYAKSPQEDAAQRQEDATGVTDISDGLPPTNDVPGYESYMQHSTANPKRFG